MAPYAFRRQPLRGLYLLYQLITTLFVRVPLWSLLALPRSFRPRKSWDIRRVVWVKFVRHLLTIVSSAGPLAKIPNHLAITPGAGVHGVWVEPTPTLIIGEMKSWMTAAAVSPIRLPGYWMYKKGSKPARGAPPSPGEKVVYLLHGGAYIRLSAHPSDPTANIGRGLLDHLDSVQRVFSIEYRLSSHKPYEVANPFPAAIIDALAGYNYLVDTVGFSPSDIIVCGDSAGANLAHALTRYLVENKLPAVREIPRDSSLYINLPAPPDRLILLSPWSDLSTSHEKLGASSERFAVSDYIIPGQADYARDAFLGPFGIGAATHNRYISPASLHPSMTINFKGFPRTFIAAGGAEVLWDQIQTLRERMSKDLGEEGLEYHEAKDGVHDYLVFDWHEPERTETLKHIAKWVTS